MSQINPMLLGLGGLNTPGQQMPGMLPMGQPTGPRGTPLSPRPQGMPMGLNGMANNTPFAPMPAPAAPPPMAPAAQQQAPQGDVGQQVNPWDMFGGKHPLAAMLAGQPTHAMRDGNSAQQGAYRREQMPQQRALADRRAQEASRTMMQQEIARAANPQQKPAAPSAPPWLKADPSKW